jgi:hypothetical protein
LNCWNTIAARAPQAQSSAAQCCYIDAFEDDPPSGWLNQSIDQPQQSGFAGAGPADDANKTAFFDLQRHIGDGSFDPELPRQALDFQHPMARVLCRNQSAKWLLGPNRDARVAVKLQIRDRIPEGRDGGARSSNILDTTE